MVYVRKCYGRDLATRSPRLTLVRLSVLSRLNLSVSLVLSLTMRTFHIGGAASRATADDNIQVKHDGTIRLHNIKVVEKEDGKLVATYLVLVSYQLQMLMAVSVSVIRLPYGATINVKDHGSVAAWCHCCELGPTYAPDYY